MTLCGGSGLFALHSGMRPEDAGRGKLTEFVSDHRFLDVHRNELIAIMHREGMADEIGGDRAAPRPRFDHLLLVGLVQRLDFFLQL